MDAVRSQNSRNLRRNIRPLLDNLAARSCYQKDLLMSLNSLHTSFLVVIAIGRSFTSAKIRTSYNCTKITPISIDLMN